MRHRQAVISRAKSCCEYCQSQLRFAMDPFSLEHIWPRSRGGKTTLENLALSCQGCNWFKGSRVEGVDELTGQIVPLFHPRQQSWTDHFAWNPDCTVMVGLTPMGRATVTLLQLNREGLVNLRRVLYKLKLHPPVL